MGREGLGTIWGKCERAKQLPNQDASPASTRPWIVAYSIHRLHPASPPHPLPLTSRSDMQAFAQQPSSPAPRAQSLGTSHISADSSTPANRHQIHTRPNLPTTPQHKSMFHFTQNSSPDGPWALPNHIPKALEIRCAEIIGLIPTILSTQWLFQVSPHILHLPTISHNHLWFSCDEGYGFYITLLHYITIGHNPTRAPLKQPSPTTSDNPWNGYLTDLTVAQFCQMDGCTVKLKRYCFLQHHI